MISDVSSGEPGDVTFPIMGTVAECVQPLNVGTTTTEVRVSIAFAHDRPCAIGLATGPEGDLGPTRTPPTSCYLLGVQICHRSVELVRRLYPTEIESAFAVVVSDTCPVGSVCDRVYATDAALAIVPPVPGTDPLWLHVFGKRVPDRVEAWHGPLPELTRILLPLP